MENRIYYICVFFIILCSSVHAQQTKCICDTIPYEFIQEKIVIPVVVNGVKTKYIVDTGGKTGTMWEEAMEMKVESAGSLVSISDLNGSGISYQKGILKNIQLSANYQINELHTMVLPEVGMFKKLGVAGILGGDAFAQSVITFDSRKKVMIINYPYRPLGLKIQDGVEMFSGTVHHSIVNVNVGGIDKKMLFDSGAHGFFIISKDDFVELREKGVCEQVATAYGVNGAGLLGLGQPVDVFKGSVSELNFLGKRFTNVGCITNPNSQSIIGVDILKYGKVVIDYMRSRFYFFPFDDVVEDMGGAPKTWNVGILPLNERFEVVTVWDSMKNQVSFGEEVIDINGISLEGLPMDQTKIDEIMDSIEGDRAYIIVLRNGKKEKIEIRKE